MKKIFKLRGEILILFLVSSLITFIVTAILADFYRNLDFEKKSIYKNAIERNNTSIENVESILETDSKDENIIKYNLKKKADELYRYGSDNIFLVDKDGNVYDSLFDYGIKRIDFEDKDNYFEIRDIRYIAKNVIKINDDFYVVTVEGNYCKGDIDKLTIWIILDLILFIILISGRIKYIDVISSRVKKISRGDFDVKVPCKYENELTLLSRDINRMAENLKNNDIKQKEFITNISHDLRTPLTTILGYVNMIKEKKYKNEEELEKYIGVINKKSIYLKNLIDDFFDYTKLMSHDISLEKVDINIDDCVKELLYEATENFKLKNLRIISDIKSGEKIVIGDPMLMGRVFENLISNALKYSKEGTFVNVNLFREGKNVIFTISNIPKDSLDKEDINNFFNRLYKKDRARKSEGNGLGLSIANEIVKIHEGSIRAEKEEEKVKFTIKLPCKNK